MNVDQIVPKVLTNFLLDNYTFVKRELELEDVYDLKKQLLNR